MGHSVSTVFFDRARIVISRFNGSGKDDLELKATLVCPLSFDFYTEVLSLGNSKRILETSELIKSALVEDDSEFVIASFLFSKGKCLSSVFDCELSPDEFSAESALEGERFLSRPHDYVMQPVPLTSERPLLYRKIALAYIPKRFVNRIKFIFTPVRREVSLITLSHLSLQQTALHRSADFFLFEIESDYMAMSVASQSSLEEMKYWELQSESDAAYFVLQQLQQRAKKNPRGVIFLTGSHAGDAAHQFLSDMAHLPVKRLSFPSSAADDSDISVVISAGASLSLLQSLGDVAQGTSR